MRLVTVFPAFLPFISSSSTPSAINTDTIDHNFNETPVTSATHGSVWYAISKNTVDLMGWQEGKQFCEDLGLNYSAVYSQAEWDSLWSLFKANENEPHAYGVWLGLSLPDPFEAVYASRDECMKEYAWTNGDKLGDGFHAWHWNKPEHCWGVTNIRRRWLWYWPDWPKMESWDDGPADYRSKVACEYRANGIGGECQELSAEVMTYEISAF